VLPLISFSFAWFSMKTMGLRFVGYRLSVASLPRFLFCRLLLPGLVLLRPPLLLAVPPRLRLFRVPRSLPLAPTSTRHETDAITIRDSDSVPLMRGNHSCFEVGLMPGGSDDPVTANATFALPFAALAFAVAVADDVRCRADLCTENQRRVEHRSLPLARIGTKLLKVIKKEMKGCQGGSVDFVPLDARLRTGGG
jgi:hypothetical protein